jgi:hypothetical protein
VIDLPVSQIPVKLTAGAERKVSAELHVHGGMYCVSCTRTRSAFLPFISDISLKPGYQTRATAHRQIAIPKEAYSDHPSIPVLYTV